LIHPGPARGARYTIILFGGLWDDKWRRRQQIAWRLVEYPEFERVFFIESPLTLPSLLKYFLGAADRDATARWPRVLRKGFVWQPGERPVWVLTPLSFLFQFGEDASQSWQKRAQHWWIRKKVRELADEVEVDRLLLFVALPDWTVQYHEDLFGASIFLFDSTELFHAHPRLRQQDPHYKRIAQNEDDLTKRARIVTCASRKSWRDKQKLNSNVHYLPNAADIDLFSEVGPDLGFRERHGLGSDSVLLAYLGVDNGRLNRSILDYLLCYNSNWYLCVIGPDSPSFPQGKRVITLGELPKRRAVGVLKAMDVCLLPHEINEFTDSQSPIKLYDYLASGKPIVSTSVAGTCDFRGAVLIADSKEEFAAKVEQALDTDTDDMREQRLRLARENSWQARVQSLVSIVRSELVGKEHHGE